jgi:transcriptional regulator with XRE-family HTH domain
MAKLEEVLSEIAKWRKEKKVTLNEIAKKMDSKPSTIGDLLGGKTRNLSEERREKLYEITGLEILREPIERLESVGYVRKEGSKALVKVKRKSNMKYENINGVTRKLSEIDENLAGLKIILMQQLPSYEACQIYKSGSNFDVEDRAQIVETAIDILVEQMNHYRLTNQKDRESLVKYLRDLGEVDRWGYLVNIFNNITKPSSVPDTFLRTYEPPNKNRNKEK